MSEAEKARNIIESRKDIRLVGRAVRERWPMSPEFRVQIIAKLMDIVIDPEATDRDIIAASRVLASIDKMNVDLENAAKNMTLDELKDELRDRLSEMMQTQEASRIGNDGADSSSTEQQ